MNTRKGQVVNANFAAVECAPRLGLAPLCRTLLLAYLIVLPASHAFEIHVWLPWPFFVLLCSIPLSFTSLITRGCVQRVFHRCDLWIVVLLAWLALVTIIDVLQRGGSPREHQFNHLLSYFGVIGVYYFGLKALIIAAGVSKERMHAYALASFLVISVFSYVEFFGKAFWGIDVDNYIPRIFDEEYNPLQGGIYIRARGLASESGNYALYLETLMPVLAGYFWASQRFWIAALVIGVGVAALILTFSAAAFVALPLAILLTLFARWAVRRKRHPRRLRVWGGILIGVPAAIAIAVMTGIEADVLLGIYDKLTFWDEASAGDRLGRWMEAYERVSDNPLLGVGAGGFLGADLQFGVVSWWLQLLLEGGVLALVLIALFLGHAFMLALKNQIRHPGFGIAIAAAAAHYFVISDYWLPWLWFVIALLLTCGSQPLPDSGRVVVARSRSARKGTGQ